MLIVRNTYAAGKVGFKVESDLFVILGFPHQAALTEHNTADPRIRCVEEATIMKQALKENVQHLCAADCLLPSGEDSDKVFQDLCSKSHYTRAKVPTIIPPLGQYIQAMLCEQHKTAALKDKQALKDKKSAIKESPMGKLVGDLDEGGKATLDRLGGNRHEAFDITGDLDPSDYKELLSNPEAHPEVVNTIIATGGGKSSSTSHAVASSISATAERGVTQSLYVRSFEHLLSDRSSRESLLAHGGAKDFKVPNFHELARVFANAALKSDNVCMIFHLPQPISKQVGIEPLNPVPNWIEYAPKHIHTFIEKFRFQYPADVLLKKHIDEELLPSSPGRFERYHLQALSSSSSSQVAPPSRKRERELELENQNLKLQIKVMKLQKKLGEKPKMEADEEKESEESEEFDEESYA